MSHFTRMKTEIRDREALLQALAALGYNQVEEGHGLSLYGYQGDVRPETAEIVIRRSHLSSASNDVGFHWTGSAYEAIISEYDGRAFPKLLAQVKQQYAYHVIVNEAAQQGFTVAQEEKQQDGSVRVVVQRWR